MRIAVCDACILRACMNVYFGQRQNDLSAHNFVWRELKTDQIISPPSKIGKLDVSCNYLKLPYMDILALRMSRSTKHLFVKFRRSQVVTDFPKQTGASN